MSPWRSWPSKLSFRPTLPPPTRSAASPNRRSNHRWREVGLPAQPSRSNARTFDQGAELGPHHVLGDAAHPGGRVETAIGAGHHARRIAHYLGDALDPVGHYLRMLDVIGHGIYHAGHEHLAVGQGHTHQHLVFVSVPRIGERQI